MSSRKIAIFEFENESLQRSREMPFLIECLHSKGWEAEVIIFAVSQKEEIFESVLRDCVAYISRVKLQKLSRLSKESYLELLRELEKGGILGFPTADAIMSFEAKDSLLRLISSGLVAEDSFGYGDKERFKDSFAYSLARGERVLDPATGKGGVWRVSAGEANGRERIKPEEKIRIVAASNHQVREVRLGDFLEGYAAYIDEERVILDMPFLPFIKEGEIRIFMLHDTPYEILRKIPPKEPPFAFGTSLFLGATYRYESLDKYSALLGWFGSKLPEMAMKLSNNGIPPLWSADFIPTDKGYVLNGLNGTAVDFLARLDITDALANHIIRTIREADKRQS